MAWRRPGDKPLSEPMMVCLTTHICVTQPQWVNHVRHLSSELNRYVESIVDKKEKYHESFTGNLSSLAEFNEWFQSRFSALQHFQDLVHVYLETAGSLIKPDDSVSQTSQLTYRSRSSRHKSSRTGFRRSSGPRLTKAYDVTIQRYRNSHAKNEDSKMHILRYMGSKFCVKFQRCPLKFHTKFWTHTPQNMHFTRC